MKHKRSVQKSKRDLYVVLLIVGIFIVFCGKAYSMKKDNISYMGDGEQNDLISA